MQYLSFFQWFKGIFSEGNSLFYSLGKSIGGEMFGLFAYYLASPFNLIFTLFSDDNAIFAFEVVLVLKMALASLSMCYFLNRGKETKFRNLIFSISYALCTYAITYGFNVMWLDAMILLPLVIRRN